MKRFVVIVLLPLLLAGCMSSSKVKSDVRHSILLNLSLHLSLENSSQFKVVLKNISSDRIWEHYVTPLLTLWIIREGEVPVSYTKFGAMFHVCPVPIMEPGEEQVFLVKISDFGFLTSEKINLKDSLVFIEYFSGDNRLYSNTIKIESDILVGGWPIKKSDLSSEGAPLSEK